MIEDHDTRLRRLRMRSWRRGTKEMDLILGPFSDGPMAGLDAGMLDLYEELLTENDQDLYPWITARIAGRSAGPDRLAPVLDVVATHAARHLSPGR
ncbi:MAG: succinate dehydrogenase assembly factor 2 [Paracoccus sp. (in: a-proteobacteria)]|nr:succinate dehydrogenase assembly factor 2 [Paracoccus sp. (in: a-proteobacteria)]